MMGHGSGGSMMKRIIDEVFFDAYGSPELAQGNDASVLELAAGTGNGGAQGCACEGASRPARIAFSTDSFVVTPHFFPGGDIGRLAVCGTVNDVATSGAIPKWLSLGMVLEEGFPMDDLRKICESIQAAADEAGVHIVTGDTKVVNRGHGDGIYINTSGIGEIPEGVELGGQLCQPGDAILLTGTLGDHGITIMGCREGLNFQADVESDAAPLNHLIQGVIHEAGADNVRCFRDPTRGGIASTLNELADQCSCDFTINEEAIPVKPVVQGACEMLGYDVLQVANEGKMVCVVAGDAADAALHAMKESPYGVDAAIIGEVGDRVSIDADGRTPKVYLRTAFGSTRILDMLVGEQLPRIC